MVIDGYVIRSTDLNVILDKLDNVKTKIKDIVQEEYKKLLADEIAFICDRVSLNIFKRDEKITIYDAAVMNVGERIKRAETLNDETLFNFRIFAHILPYENNTYIKVMCQNRLLLKAFEELEDYSLSEIQCENNKNKKKNVWETIHSIYKNTEPAVISLTQEPEPTKDLTFKSVKDRATEEAIHSIMSRLLSTISAGKEISPIYLHRYYHEAVNISANNQNVKKELTDKQTRLMEIFIDLNKEENKDIIYKLPVELNAENILS